MCICIHTYIHTYLHAYIHKYIHAYAREIYNINVIDISIKFIIIINKCAL